MGAQRAKRASQQNGQGGEGKAAPRNLGDRANDYFDGIVGDKKKPGKVYNSQGNKQIREWEKEESESNSNIKGREQNLIELAKRVDNWMNGDNSDVKRGEFLAQIDAWRSEGDSIDTERKLLALVAPGIDKPKDIPRNVAEKLMQQLGENRVPEESTAENVFEAYQQMLKDRFGSDYDSIVDNYFDKALSLANEKGGEPVKGVSVSDIVAKGFTEDEAQKIYDRAFNGKSAIAQRRLGKKLKSVEGKSEKEKASAVGGWYLQFVKNETEEERMNDLLTKAISQKTSSTRKVTIDLTAADGTYYSKDGSTYHGGAAAADDKFKYVVVGNKAKVFVKKGSGWKRKTQTSRGTKANYDIGRMIDKLDELTSGSSS